jgi:hypothetical protein
VPGAGELAGGGEALLTSPIEVAVAELALAGVSVLAAA